MDCAPLDANTVLRKVTISHVLLSHHAGVMSGTKVVQVFHLQSILDNECWLCIGHHCANDLAPTITVIDGAHDGQANKWWPTGRKSSQ